jgi:hypothetical protein
VGWGENGKEKRSTPITFFLNEGDEKTWGRINIKNKIYDFRKVEESAEALKPS